MSDLPKITRIDFTPRERVIFTHALRVAGGVVIQLKGVKETSVDYITAVAHLVSRPGELGALMMKVNKDVIPAEHREAYDILVEVTDNITAARVAHIKRVITEVIEKNPNAKSRMKDDMLWLCNELEKRL